MTARDLIELSDGLHRQLARLEAAIELQELASDPDVTRAQRALGAVLDDARDAADRMITATERMIISAQNVEK